MDAYCTIDEVAAVLRVTASQYTDLLTACCEAAAIEIDQAVASADPPDYLATPNALMNRVNVLRAVEWFKAADAVTGVIGYDQTGALTTPKSGFARHARTLIPVKQRFGVA